MCWYWDHWLFFSSHFSTIVASPKFKFSWMNFLYSSYCFSPKMFFIWQRYSACFFEKSSLAVMSWVLSRLLFMWNQWPLWGHCLSSWWWWWCLLSFFPWWPCLSCFPWCHPWCHPPCWNPSSFLYCLLALFYSLIFSSFCSSILTPWFLKISRSPLNLTPGFSSTNFWKDSFGWSKSLESFSNFLYCQFPLHLFTLKTNISVCFGDPLISENFWTSSLNLRSLFSAKNFSY